MSMILWKLNVLLSVVLLVDVAVSGWLYFSLENTKVVKDLNSMGLEAIPSDYQNIVKAFEPVMKKTESFSSSNEPSFISAIDNLGEGLRKSGINISRTFEPKYFSNINAGVMMFRRADEVPAQYLRSSATAQIHSMSQVVVSEVNSLR